MAAPTLALSPWFAAHLASAAVAVASPPAEPPSRNIVPESYEHPTVTFVTDDPRAKIEVVQLTPSEHAAMSWSKYRGLKEMTTPSQPLCEAPCNRTLSNLGVYAVSGPGMPRSAFFLLPRSENVTVKARTGSTGLFVLGVATMIVGALALIPSIGMTVTQEYRGYGLIGLGGSLGFIVGGTYAAYRGSTIVDVTMKDGEPRR